MRAAVASQHSCGGRTGGVRTLRSRHAPHAKTVLLDNGLEEEVKTHTRRVEIGERVTLGQACPRCGGGEGRVLSGARLPTAEVPLVLGRCIQVALSWILRWRSALRQAVHRLSAFSSCRGSGSPSNRYWRRPASIWGRTTPTLKALRTRVGGCPSCTTTGTPVGTEDTAGPGPQHGLAVAGNRSRPGGRFWPN